MSKDPSGTTNVEPAPQRKHLEEFLGDATRDIFSMRGMIAELEAGNDAAWSRVENVAHNLVARSQILKLGLLNACARELQQLIDEYRKGAPLDTLLMQCIHGAIETLALEIDSLRRA